MAAEERHQHGALLHLWRAGRFAARAKTFPPPQGLAPLILKTEEVGCTLGKGKAIFTEANLKKDGPQKRDGSSTAPDLFLVFESHSTNQSARGG